jgi:hypothetical protein
MTTKHRTSDRSAFGAKQETINATRRVFTLLDGAFFLIFVVQFKFMVAEILWKFHHTNHSARLLNFYLNFNRSNGILITDTLAQLKALIQGLLAKL